MIYVPPRHLFLRRHTDAISTHDLAFLERVLDRQLRECAYSYGLRPPVVTVVDPTSLVPISDAVGIDFVDHDGIEEAVGSRGWSAYSQHPWSLVGVKEEWSWTQAASHAALEMTVNLNLNRHVQAPDGSRWPLEICDPVEAYAYPVSTAVNGEVRDIKVSNYVLPSFWLPRDGSGGAAGGGYPWDYLGMLNGPYEVAMGGYALVERAGKQIPLGGSPRRRRERAGSRLARIRL